MQLLSHPTNSEHLLVKKALHCTGPCRYVHGYCSTATTLTNHKTSYHSEKSTTNNNNNTNLEAQRTQSSIFTSHWNVEWSWIVIGRHVLECLWVPCFLSGWCGPRHHDLNVLYLVLQVNFTYVVINCTMATYIWWLPLWYYSSSVLSWCCTWCSTHIDL